MGTFIARQSLLLCQQASLTVNAIQAQADLDKTALSNWDHVQRDQSDYTALNNERAFLTFLKDFNKVVNMHGYKRLYDPEVDPKNLRPGDEPQIAFVMNL